RRGYSKDLQKGGHSNHKARDSQSSSAPAGHHKQESKNGGGMSFMNRPQVDGNFGGPRMFRTVKDFRGRTPRNGNFNSAKQRPLPPEATGAEAFYYLKQMSSRTPMVVVTTD